MSNDLFDKKLHEYSRGEGFKQLINNRFFGNGIYILDEPETGLSIQSQLELLIRIKELSIMNSQFIIATHSPILLMLPDIDIYEISECGIELKLAHETEMMQKWEMILERKQEFIKMLF